MLLICKIRVNLIQIHSNDDSDSFDRATKKLPARLSQSVSNTPPITNGPRCPRDPFFARNEYEPARAMPLKHLERRFPLGRSSGLPIELLNGLRFWQRGLRELHFEFGKLEHMVDLSPFGQFDLDGSTKGASTFAPDCFNNEPAGRQVEGGGD